MPKKIDPELKARAVPLVTEHQQEYLTVTAAAASVARQLGVGKESVRRWVVQAQIGTGQRAGLTGAEHEEIKRLRAENRRLRGMSRLCGQQQLSSRGNSTPATADDGIHRRDENRRPCGRVDLPSPAPAGLPGCRADLPAMETPRAGLRTHHR